MRLRLRSRLRLKGEVDSYLCPGKFLTIYLVSISMTVTVRSSIARASRPLTLASSTLD